MIRDIFEKFKVFSFGAVDAKLCRPANRRLYDSLPSDCSVVFALVPYYTEPDPYPLSRYAAVRDYHGFAAELFDKVCKYINIKYPTAYARGFSDHSPFCEVEGAAAAGLGIVGDNSLLISPQYSSFVFIGEIVTTLSLPELAAEGIGLGDGIIRRCESCGACRAACPGDCAGEVGRDNCASALNQKKGELCDSDANIMKKSGYIWGCDVCQNVCPHTARAKKEGTIETPIEYFKRDRLSGESSQIISLGDEEYKMYPFSWRKREVMMRNIEIIEKAEGR